jgi:NADH-quinone oxidoreductase subunit J
MPVILSAAKDDTVAGGALNDLFIPLAIGCAVALVSALMVVLARRPVHAVVALLAHSLSLAALYLILGADMVAMGQVLIYSGAIVVLFLFVIALLPQGGTEADLGMGRVLGGVIAGCALLAGLAAWLSLAGPLPTPSASAGGNIRELGLSLFKTLIVPTELTAPLLLVSIVGAVAIWRRQERA